MKEKVFKYIFIASFLYYVILIGFALYCAFVGIESGWVMPAMSNHKMEYGKEAFISGLAIGLLYTVAVFWIIPVYQIIYIMVVGIVKIRRFYHI